MLNASARAAACGKLVVAMALLALPGSVAAQNDSWPEAIRRCWNDSAANTSFSCYYTEGKLRGTMSGKDCLVEAVKTARQQNKEGALRWILACQCGMGDAEVKQSLRDHEDEAVQLVLDTYGTFVQ